MTDEQKKVNEELLAAFKLFTNNNMQACKFLFAWFYYCHDIDDLLDTMEDGRPTMTKEEILRIFARAIEVYNDPFYLANQPVLCPIAAIATNSYATSVSFERSPMAHHRLISDVLRCCGNEMMVMVASICGGYIHMRSVSMKLWEKTWQMQHDQDGNPI